MTNRSRSGAADSFIQIDKKTWRWSPIGSTRTMITSPEGHQHALENFLIIGEQAFKDRYDLTAGRPDQGHLTRAEVASYIEAHLLTPQIWYAVVRTDGRGELFRSEEEAKRYCAAGPAAWRVVRVLEAK